MKELRFASLHRFHTSPISVNRREIDKKQWQDTLKKAMSIRSPAFLQHHGWSTITNRENASGLNSICSARKWMPATEINVNVTDYLTAE